jgi:hypothetical protein
MNTSRKTWLACVVVGLMLWTVGNTGCANPADGSGAGLSSDPNTSPSSGSSVKNLSEMLTDVSVGVGQVSNIQERSAERSVCVFEERHTSVAGQIEIALMLLRLHDRYGLRHIALEGLTRDMEFPSIKWFQDMGGPDDADLRDQIAVGLLHQGEISAVELIALCFPDVIVHAADDATAYAVELTQRAGIASTAYLYKIAFKSVPPEHYPRIQQLQQQKKINEMLEYVISHDLWAKERYQRMKKAATVVSIEQTLRDLQEIENRATSVGAEISDEDRSAMSEAKAFFEAADKRSQTMVQTALGVERAVAIVAMNIGAAHTEGVKRMLDESKTAYGVLTPLSLAQNTKSGDLSYEAFQRKNKLQSVAWKDKGLGSLLDGRRKPSPVVGEKRIQGESQHRFVTAVMARAAGGPNFPDDNLKRRLNALPYAKVQWNTVRKEPNGDVVFMTSVLGQNGSVNVWTRCGVPNAMQMFAKRKGPTLEQLLLDDLDKVKKEPGERKEPSKSPVIEMVTPDVLAAFAKEPGALAAIRFSG